LIEVYRMSDIDTVAVSGTRAQGGCGCGGSKAHATVDRNSDHGGCERPLPDRGILLGEQFALDASASQTTATDPVPTPYLNAVQVGITIHTQAGSASLDVTTLGSVDGINFFAIGTQTFAGGVGFHTGAETGINYPWLRWGFRAHSGTVTIVFAAFVYLSCQA